jgi:hypothetical protein
MAKLMDVPCAACEKFLVRRSHPSSWKFSRFLPVAFQPGRRRL